LNSLFALLGLEAWKPLLTALLLPPVPFLLLGLLGARFIPLRRGTGWLLVLLGAAGVWLSTCGAMAELLTRFALQPPKALSAETIARIRAEVKARQPWTIVVLGGGREVHAPEYDAPTLKHLSRERLSYGVWLARETGATIGFTGGVGWADVGGPPEAVVAQRVAAKELGRPLQWIESQSRDTRENAFRTAALLEKEGTKHALLVTHGWHMPRALRLFEAQAAGRIEFVPAPMGLAPVAHGQALDWLPSAEGFARVRHVLHELLGRLAGD
jgi:uncharacterized SAM-binding protein YcdF (DUF218 family)